MRPVEPLQKIARALDDWQRRSRWAGVPYGVAKKFGDDNANLLVVSLAWYGFTAIFPLLLVVVTLFGFIGQRSIGSGVVSTLHEFPVVGSSFNPASRSVLPGSALGLVVGLIGLIYGAQGVTQTAQQAMATVWNIPQVQRTGFLPRLGRSLAGLFTIGAAFVLNAFVTGYATAGTSSYAIRLPILIGLLLVNAGLYIGSVAFLLLLAKISMYAAELNPVLARSLYPRALPLGGEPTGADRKVLADIVHAEQRRDDQAIGVGFGAGAAEQAAADATRHAGDPQ